MVSYIYKCTNQACRKCNVETSFSNTGFFYCSECRKSLTFVKTIDLNTIIAGSAVGGAIIGGLIGGPEGAIIGSLVGAWIGNEQEKKKR
ncbi:hypothetical protein HZC31_03580 [Candidatus Woesearchaeota archaeon]|nr:hypothetical protein [Candidatus Woesearchaeota archaeon]